VDRSLIALKSSKIPGAVVIPMTIVLDVLYPLGIVIVPVLRLGIPIVLVLGLSCPLRIPIVVVLGLFCPVGNVPNIDRYRPCFNMDKLARGPKIALIWQDVAQIIHI
jgi:hypothetical protein